MDDGGVRFVVALLVGSSSLLLLSPSSGRAGDSSIAPADSTIGADSTRVRVVFPRSK